ncbi:ATPase [Anaerococcus sp. AGMB09787]|uniref:ATPase n=1 Tax=Anaerococcus sp. AGMB09787 TaxID=2922869 RepID=UPI001FAFB3DF|nr:ATPase [Anaerococcus sp. AGMB09787]
MLDIEAKLSSFRKMVWGEEKEQSEEELYKSTEINSKIVSDKKLELDEKLKESIRDREAFAKSKKNESLSKKEADAKNNIYVHRQFLVEDLYKRIVDKLRAYTASDVYKENLNSKIKNSIKSLSLNAEDLIIGVVEKDLDDIDFINKEAIPNEYIGGYIISNKDREFRYNFTYLNKLNMKKYEVGKKLNELLESESFNESKN